MTGSKRLTAGLRSDEIFTKATKHEGPVDDVRAWYFASSVHESCPRRWMRVASFCIIGIFLQDRHMYLTNPDTGFPKGPRRIVA